MRFLELLRIFRTIAAIPDFGDKEAVRAWLLKLCDVAKLLTEQTPTPADDAIVAGAPPRTRTATPQRNPFAAPAWPVPCKYPTEIRDSDKGVGENFAGRRPRGNWPLGAGCRRPARGLLDLPVEPPAQFPA